MNRGEGRQNEKIIFLQGGCRKKEKGIRKGREERRVQKRRKK